MDPKTYHAHVKTALKDLAAAISAFNFETHLLKSNVKELSPHVQEILGRVDLRCQDVTEKFHALYNTEMQA